MPETPLTKKLQIKPGNRVLVVNPPDGYEGLLGPLPESAQIVTPGNGPVDVAHIFARTSADVTAHLAAVRTALKPGGVLWISWPKTTAKMVTDLTRDSLWAMLEPEGLRPVTAISIDDVWSALRFKPLEDVKTTGK